MTKARHIRTIKCSQRLIADAPEDAKVLVDFQKIDLLYEVALVTRLGLILRRAIRWEKIIPISRKAPMTAEEEGKGPAFDGTENDEELRHLLKRLRIAQIKEELRKLATDPEAKVDDQLENTTKTSFQTLLVGAIREKLEMWHVPEPAHSKLDAAVADWIEQNWNTALCDVNLNHGIPLHHVNAALKAVYDQDYESAEHHAEVIQLQKSARTVAGPANLLLSALKRGPSIRTQRRQHVIQKVFTDVSVIFTLAAAVFMFCMLVIGCWELAKAVLEGFVHPGGSEENGHKFLLTSLTALEIILVAPLPYLLVLALNRYIKALAYQEKTDEFRKELLEFKAFEVALFIAIIAATSVSKILNDQFTFEVALPVVIIIGILALYYYIIERACREA